MYIWTMNEKTIQEVRQHIEHYVKDTGCKVPFDYKTLEDIMTSPRMCPKTESRVMERLRLKLIAMEIFAHEHYNEKSFIAAETVFIELKRWIEESKK